MFVDTCVQVYVCRYVHAEVGRSAVKAGCFPYLLFILFPQAGSPAEPGAC